MKKSILLLAVSFGMLAFTSCKKETIEPVVENPTEPVVVVETEYTFEFLATDVVGENNYTDIVVRVNGDSIGVTPSTALNTEGIYNSNGQVASLSMDGDINSYYTIEAYTSSGELIMSVNNAQFLENLSEDFGEGRIYLTDSFEEDDNSPVGSGGIDCHFVDINNKLVFLFEVSN
jgi:hypothetical protein